jgi:hypothetical protein
VGTMPDVGRPLSFLFLVFSLYDSLHLVIVKEIIRLFDALLNGRIILRLILKKYNVVIDLAQSAVQIGLLWTV